MRVVFLHGLGDGDPELGWLDGLNSGLTSAGFPSIDRDSVIAPRYRSHFETAGISAKVPPVTYKPKDDSDARLAFERRQAAVQRFLGYEAGVGTFGYARVPDAPVTFVQNAVINSVPLLDLPHVKRYMLDEGLRGAILKYVLDHLPATGEIILIAHSLGSVVAIDLLDNLHPGLHVRRFVTIGSPASAKALHVNSDRLLKRFPYGRVDDWSNFLDTGDPVTAGRGLASTFQGAQDFTVDIGHKHDSKLYLGHTSIAKLIAQTLYPTNSVALRGGDLTVRLTDNEATVLLSLHFAHAVQRHIKDKDAAVRYTGALTAQQDEIVAQAERDAAIRGTGVAQEIAQLAGDNLPRLPHRWKMHDAVGELVVLALTNLVEPYEIEVERAPREALPDIAVELGFQRSTGTKIGNSIEEVQTHIGRKSGVPWGRVLTAAAGVAIIAAGPVGLALAAPVGVFGAAALTGGLAALGPGGMVGGLAMLGGLAGTGAAVTTSAATLSGGPVEPVADSNALVLRVAAEYARKSLDLPYDKGLWYSITELESQLSARINRLAVYSDPKSSKLETLRVGQRTVALLMDFMLEKELGPTEFSSAEGDTDRAIEKALRTMDENARMAAWNRD
ncbi:hypothetical protein [Rhodococcoides yunnanense]|uniref:hypothetical protein n=1 Tax=Rhodococcoides yunnanense TaxID=278209 RepID=UPI000932EDD8|nr:hypothetical protein [Rhodococcus yunnanensis]